MNAKAIVALKDTDVIKIVDCEDHSNVCFEGTVAAAKEWCWNYHIIEHGYKMGWTVQEVS